MLLDRVDELLDAAGAQGLLESRPKMAGLVGADEALLALKRKPASGLWSWQWPEGRAGQWVAAEAR